ncbi:MAG: UDP-N-acetyl-D-mannosamine dehydrogenase [Rhodospirillaceae bacterium TMED8]|nr:UDP-N-acetyl-D-mannosamine dehydrogenase [Magnetovibrio sp.]OUT51454.1 MAG: UDP-N-acetyl-D-mannosamine dehydrogenase [Rhodospirillaceae bacterium TMED8]|tara:strand:+ start:4725 stop:5996 length:1272 start_codon:yes stop_codon:yes gene_type:complete
MAYAEKFETLCVIGLGYVGLPTAAVFASRGLEVVGVDTNQNTVATINSGAIHIVEPDLDILVNGAVATKKLRAAARAEAADAFIIAVPTPFTDNHKPDLSYLQAAADDLADVLKAGDLVIIESTSPVGATEKISTHLAAKRPDLSFPHNSCMEANISIAHSPERVLPGRVLIELIRNDRVVGGITPNCAKRAAELYAIAVEGRCLQTSARTAELVKLAENAHRDVSVAFANELANVADKLDIDPWEAIRLANHHPRVNILNPGPGVGGHCIAVDPWFIVDSAPEDTPLIQAARLVNNGRPARIANAVTAAAAATGLTAPMIGCLGLTYKADIDDIRESPAIAVVKILAMSFKIRIAEPYLNILPDELADLPNVELSDIQSTIIASDIVVLLTDHKQFKTLDPTAFENKKLINTRGNLKKPRNR